MGLAERDADRLQQLTLAERLEQALHRSLPQQAGPVSPVAAGSHEDDGDRLPAPGQLLRQLDPRLTRHGDVQDQAGDRVRDARGQEVPGRCERRRGETALPEQLRQGLPHRQIIVHNHHERTAGHGTSHAPGLDHTSEFIFYWHALRGSRGSRVCQCRPTVDDTFVSVGSAEGRAAPAPNLRVANASRRSRPTGGDSGEAPLWLAQAGPATANGRTNQPPATLLTVSPSKPARKTDRLPGHWCSSSDASADEYARPRPAR